MVDDEVRRDRVHVPIQVVANETLHQLPDHENKAQVAKLGGPAFRVLPAPAATRTLMSMRS